MRLEVQLSMDGAAFDNGPGQLEVTRILRDLADVIEAGPWDVEVPIRMRDANGNRVGFALVTESELAD